MMRLNTLLLFLMTICLGCDTAQKEFVSGSDSTKCLTLLLNDEIFKKENSGADTLYFLTNKFYNKSWPQKTKHFYLKYIEDNPQSKIMNVGPAYPSDERIRIEILKFDFRSDSVRILMKDYGGNLFYLFNAAKNKNGWCSEKVIIEEGGRHKEIPYSNERWYLDLKKKIKPVKPMFPPPEPK